MNESCQHCSFSLSAGLPAPPRGGCALDRGTDALSLSAPSRQAAAAHTLKSQCLIFGQPWCNGSVMRVYRRAVRHSAVSAGGRGRIGLHPLQRARIIHRHAFLQHGHESGSNVCLSICDVFVLLLLFFVSRRWRTQIFFCDCQR